MQYRIEKGEKWRGRGKGDNDLQTKVLVKLGHLADVGGLLGLALQFDDGGLNLLQV